MKTILLDTVAWDLVVDAAGNIAVASDPYSQAQDAACALRLFQGELWYDTTKGVPYWQQIMGRLPPISLIRAKLTNAALTVPGVVGVRVFFASFKNRTVRGQVQIRNSNGQTSTAGF